MYKDETSIQVPPDSMTANTSNLTPPPEPRSWHQYVIPRRLPRALLVCSRALTSPSIRGLPPRCRSRRHPCPRRRPQGGQNAGTGNVKIEVQLSLCSAGLPDLSVELAVRALRPLNLRHELLLTCVPPISRRSHSSKFRTEKEAVSNPSRTDVLQLYGCWTVTGPD